MKLGEIKGISAELNIKIKKTNDYIAISSTRVNVSQEEKRTRLIMTTIATL